MIVLLEKEELLIQSRQDGLDKKGVFVQRSGIIKCFPFFILI